MKEVILNEQYLAILVSTVVPIITSIFSYFAAVRKSKRDFEIEIMKLDKANEAEINKLKLETEHEIKMVNEEMKASAVSSYMNDPKKLNENIDHIQSAVEKIERMSNKNNNHPALKRQKK